LLNDVEDAEDRRFIAVVTTTTDQQSQHQCPQIEKRKQGVQIGGEG
jgi:hypothetical protein